MNVEKIRKIEEKTAKSDMPEVKVGDSVVVDTIIRDGDKKRIQKFKGLVIAISGKGASKTFTVRKISYGIGVEKIFPFNSANIAKIEVLKNADVRRSKLYYLRNRIGKAAMKLKFKDLIVEESPKVEEVESVKEEKEESKEVEVTEEIKATE